MSAARAWEIVIGDADNRRLYGRVRLLSNLLERMGKEYFAVPAAEGNALFEREIESATEDELQALFFE